MKPSLTMIAQRFASMLLQLFALAGVLALAWSGAASAQVAGNVRFSPNGNLVGYYDAAKPEVIVYDYTAFPAAGTGKRLTVARPLTPDKERHWAVGDDGSVWIEYGMKLEHYYPGTMPNRVVDLSPVIAGIPNRKLLSLVSVGPNRSAVYVFSRPDGSIAEVRCPLTPAIEASDGPATLCKGSSFAPAAAGYTSPCCDFTIEKTADNSEYMIQTSVNSDGMRRGVRRMNGSSYLNLISPANDLGAGQVGLGGKYLISQRKDAKTYVVSSYDGSFVIIDSTDVITAFEDVRGAPKAYIIRRSSDSPQKVIVQGLRDSFRLEVTLQDRADAIQISPNGKYFVLSNPNRPYGIDALLLRYYGQPPEVVDAILMARISKAVAGQQWDAALVDITELEKRSQKPLPEDFYYYQVDTLAKAGRKTEAQAKASAFIAKYGRASPNYPRMIEILAE